MALIQALLPVPASRADAEADERVRRTRQELVDVVEIVTEKFDRTWWQQYAAKLAARFQQGAIHVRAVAVDIL